jgi:bacterioferritin-associated ferredoxin
MFVCLCTGATSEIVAEVVARGALTSKQVAAACGAGADCGRCRHTVRAIIAAGRPSDAAPVTAPLADVTRICRHRLTCLGTAGCTGDSGSAQVQHLSTASQ